MSRMWQKESGSLNSALPHLSTGFDALHLLLGTEMADIAAATQCVHYPYRNYAWLHAPNWIEVLDVDSNADKWTIMA